MTPKFKLGDEVRVVKYGHPMWCNRNDAMYEHLVKNPVIQDLGESVVFDISSEMIGRTGVVSKISDDGQYSLDKIEGKCSWYNEEQLEPVAGEQVDKKMEKQNLRYPDSGMIGQKRAMPVAEERDEMPFMYHLLESLSKQSNEMSEAVSLLEDKLNLIILFDPHEQKAIPENSSGQGLIFEFDHQINRLSFQNEKLRARLRHLNRII